MSSANIACVGLLGLSAWVDATDADGVSFPLGMLYPYSSDLRRVCTSFDALLAEWPQAALMLTGAPRTNRQAPSADATAAAATFLESVATLYGRIAFAGTVGTSLARGYAHVSEALADDGRLQGVGASAGPAG